MGLFRILSIDGGGIRGMIPATILTYLEACLQKNSGNEDARIADYFDLIAGTSTGGILTALYLTPDENNRPRFSSQDALNLYKERGHQIFHATLWHKIMSFNGLISAKYSPDIFEDLLYELFGSTRISELLKPCIIPCFDLKNNAAIFFNQSDHQESSKPDFFVRQVIRATTAAPSYFPVAEITSCDNVPFSLIDGGVFANNPTLSAYIESHKTSHAAIPPQEMLILSLGTGAASSDFNVRSLRHSGMTQWALPLFNILLSSNSEIVHHKLNIIFKENNVSTNYLRIQTDFTSYGYDEIPFDTIRPKDLTDLYDLGCKLTEDYKDELNAFSLRLINQA